MRWLRISAIVLAALIIILLVWWVAKPIEVNYQDVMQMHIGGTKINIFRIDKFGSMLTYAHADIVFDSAGDKAGMATALLQASVIDNPPRYNPPVQYVDVEIDSSPDISPGEYQIDGHFQVHGINIASIPITVNIEKSGDDIVQTSLGPAYRANAHLPGEQVWPPVTEKTVLVGTQKIPVTYRESLDMGFGEYKGLLIMANTSGTILKGKQITYKLNLPAMPPGYPPEIKLE